MRLLVLEALEARRLATEAVLRRLGPQPEIGPAAMAAKFDRRFRRLPHTNVMNDALAQLLVEPGGSLMIWTPPRAGKSELASRWFPDWWLTHWPTHRIVLTAYGERLPTRHSVAARDIMFAHGHEYGLAVSKAQAEKTSWSLTTGGGVIARGVGSGLTGEDMDCLSGDANIITPEGVRSIASIVESGDLPMVLSFNHETGIREWRPVIATRKVEDRQIVKIHTRSGRVIECTPDHRVYTGRGYVAAANLVAGDRLTEVCSVDVRAVRRTDHTCPVGGRTVDAGAGVGCLVQHCMPGSEDSDRVSVQAVREDVCSTEVRGRQTRTHRPASAAVLQPPMSGRLPEDCEGAAMSSMRGTHDSSGGSKAGDIGLLLPSVPIDWSAGEPENGNECRDGMEVSGMRDRRPALQFADSALLTRVREPRPFEGHARQGELPIQGRNKLRQLVSADAAADLGSGQPRMPGVPPDTATYPLPEGGQTCGSVSAGYPSHQREAAGQSCGEPDNAVHHVSRRTSCEAGDVVASVQHVRGTGIDVYDLQVAGNRNFFANEILVHNCGIIDDPVKDREAAESELIRAKVWDWYSGAFLSRRVPHTRTCVIMTRWRTDDLAGRILDSEGRVEEGGRWRVVHLPALALPPDPEKGIYPDALGRAVGEPLPHPKLAADDWEGMAAHWATQRERSTARDWNALYQGVPFDAEGALVSEQDIRDHTGDAPREFRRLAVGVDPAGGGRDSVGVVVAGLDGEGRVWWLEDRTRRMSAVEWPRLVCEVADRWGADRVVVETNYGGDLGTAAVSQAWGELVREGQVSGLCPLVVSVTARKSKVLRAEPIAQAIRTGRVWFARGAVLRQLTTEWQMWTPGSKWSPGALDAAVHVATELLPALPRGAQITAVDGVSRQQVAADGLAGMRR